MNAGWAAKFPDHARRAGRPVFDWNILPGIDPEAAKQAKEEHMRETLRAKRHRQRANRQKRNDEAREQRQRERQRPPAEEPEVIDSWSDSGD